MRYARSWATKKDLGLHTEMISDGVLPLLENGVINGSKKQRDVGKICVTFLMARASCKDYVDNNPVIRMLPVDVCNNPAVISQQRPTWYRSIPALR